jgi:hypothetical protein
MVNYGSLAVYAVIAIVVVVIIIAVVFFVNRSKNTAITISTSVTVTLVTGNYVIIPTWKPDPTMSTQLCIFQPIGTSMNFQNVAPLPSTAYWSIAPTTAMNMYTIQNTITGTYLGTSGLAAGANPDRIPAIVDVGEAGTPLSWLLEQQASGQYIISNMSLETHGNKWYLMLDLPSGYVLFTPNEAQATKFTLGR